MGRVIGSVLLGVVLLGAGAGLWLVASQPPAVDLADGATETVDLGDLLRESHGCRECVRFAYFWSPSVPLSRLGVAEATAAAAKLSTPLFVVPEHALLELADSSLVKFREELSRAGVTAQYPSMIVLIGDRLHGPAITGYQEVQQYETLLADRMIDGADPNGLRGAPSEEVARPDNQDGDFNSARATYVDVVWSYPTRPPPGAFFRRVPETPFIAFDQRRKVSLLHLETDERILGPGFVDFVPTPDARLFVTPGVTESGLEFYVMSEVVRVGRLADGTPFDTIYVDPKMSDQYPSVGVLWNAQDGMQTRYRILMSWFEGLAFRDYEVTWTGYRDATVRPITPKRTGCSGMALSTPIMSKDGRELAARDESTGTTKIFSLADDGSCEEVEDLGRPTSKVGFSVDGRRVAFSASDEDGSSYTYVYNRDTRETWQIPGSRSWGLVIPEFVGQDSLLYLAIDGDNRSFAEFRMVCCVR